MIKKLYLASFMFLAITLQNQAAPDSVSIDTIDNYKGWGWEVLVVKNNFITLGIVPSIGGRVLQYDFGVDTFMIVNPNPAVLGQYPSNPYATTWGYGGYKTWPAPQSVWNWPPPPTFAWGNYDYETLHASNDSVVIWLKGQTETIRAPGLRFDRYISAYRNSTRVKVKTVLYNDDNSEQSWSIWDVTQTIVQHETEGDYTNISGYIPLASSDDIWDNGGGPSSEEVLPGIYKLNYTSSEGKIFSTASEGWSCWVDERDKQCYAKLFNLVQGADYPDKGANVEYYTNGSSKYMEMEILGPILPISPNGGSISFTEDWYASATSGPMYTANHAGTVLSPLEYNRAIYTVSGEFGAFNEGEFRLAFLANDESVLTIANAVSVSPASKVILNEIIDPPKSTEYIELQAFDADGNFIQSLGRTDMLSDDNFIAYKAGTESVIDGLADETFWDSASWYPLDYVWLPYGDDVAPEDFTGKFKLSWNDNYLLLFVEIIDDVLYDIHTDPLDNYWNDDCVEVFVDEDHSGGDHLNNFNAFAYHVGINYDVVDNGLSGAALFNDHIETARVRAGNTYTWELAVKIFDDTYVNDGSSVPVILTHLKDMGFSLAYCDNDASATRENFIGSKYLPEAQSNDSYINASLFGSLELIDPKGGTTPPESITNMELKAIKVYPNPVSDRLSYSFSGVPSNEIAYSIWSQTGQIIQSGILESHQETGSIAIGYLTPGMYILEFKNQESVFMKQILIF